MRRVTGAYVAVAGVDVAFAAAGQESARRVTKPLLMPVLMIGRDRPTQRALALCGAGDVALLWTGDTAFRVGLGSFLAGQLAWVSALRSRPSARLVRRHPSLLVPYVGAWTALNAYLWPRTGRDRWAVVVYSSALLAMAVTALDRGGRTAIGGALFLTSDALLAVDRFGGPRLPGHEAWVMATYDAGQLLMAGSR